MIKKVILVFKTHFDIGFTDLAENVIKSYTGSMLDDLLAVCGGTKDLGRLRYIWTIPAWPLKVMTERSGDKKKQLDELIINGQVVWHALPFTSHFDFTGLEDSIQWFKYSRELSRIYGKPQPLSAKMTDVPGHGCMLPAVLSGANVKFLHLGCNEFAMPPEVPSLFFWQSPDGSRVLTFYDKGGYGSGLLPPNGWEFPVWMAFMHTSDNIGPHSEEQVRHFVKEAREAFPDAEIVSGSMDDFYRELSECDLSSIPLVNKDFADTWIHGVGSYPKEVSMIRDARLRLSGAKKLFMLNNRAHGTKSADFNKTVNEAYDNLILFGEHTWGLDVKTWLGSGRVYEKIAFSAEKENAACKRMEASWQEQSLRAKNAERFSAAALEAVKANEELSVFNPNGSPYTGWAYLDENPDPVIQNMLKHCGTESIFGRPCLYVKDIPALSAIDIKQCLGNNPVKPLKITRKGSMCSAENHRYRVEFNKNTGIIERVFDKVLNAAILEEKNGKGVFSYQYDKYGSDDIERYLEEYAYKTSDWGIKDNGRENYPECRRETFNPSLHEFRTEEHTLVFVYKGKASEKYGDAEKIELRLTLPAIGDELFAELKLSGKQETPYIESGSFVMPLSCCHPNYMINKNGCLLNPETDIADSANHVFYCLEAFIAAQENQNGILAVAHDTPLVSIGETGIYTFRHSYEEHEPVLYFNLFNNMWGTNFPQWIGGDFTYRFTISGFTDRSSVMQRALSLNDSARVLKSIPAEPPVLLPEFLQVITMEPAEKGISIRIRDTSGKKRRLLLRSKNENSGLCLLDFFNSPITALSKGSITFDFEPYAIRTIYVTA